MRIASLVLLFLAAQLAPSIHALLPDEEFAPHCTDGSPSTHFCHCEIDHHAPPCAICTHFVGGGLLLEVDATSAGATCDAMAAAPQAPVVERLLLASTSPRGPPGPLI